MALTISEHLPCVKRSAGPSTFGVSFHLYNTISRGSSDPDAFTEIKQLFKDSAQKGNPGIQAQVHMALF